jgi:hypothetical protein
VSSWVVVDKATRKAVLETFSANLAARINRERYEVVPILRYLAGVNAAAKSPTPKG